MRNSPAEHSLVRHGAALVLALGWLCAARTCDGVEVDVRIGDAERFPKTMYAFNSNLLTATAVHNVTYDGPEFEDTVEALRPAALRFPGGTIANYYLWRSDSFSNPKGDKTKWVEEQIRLFDKVGRPYGLPGFVRLCDARKTNVIWVLNVYDETPESAVALFEHLNKKGLRVTAVEMANEPYWDPRSLMNVWDYIQYCEPIARALKKRHPQIKIGACFGPLNQPADYEKNWNAVLAEQYWYDAIVYHEYFGGQGNALEKGHAVAIDELLNCDAFIDAPVTGLAKTAPGKPIWFTEWNLGASAIKRWKNQGGEALFLAATFLRLLEHRDKIDWACFHEIYGDVYGTTEFDPVTGKLRKFASWSVFHLIGATCDGATAFRQATFSDPALRGFAADHSSGSRLFVLNRTANEYTIKLPDSFSSGSIQRTLSCPPTKTISSPEFGNDETRRANGTALIPAFSVSLIGVNPRLKQVGSAQGETENLLPRRPGLTLWHPPFADRQPEFDEADVYAVDLNSIRDKEIVVVKLNLSPLQLKAGDTYRFELEARGEDADGFIVNLPEARRAVDDQARFNQPNSMFRRLRFTFEYDPNANDGVITFVFPASTVANGGRILLQNFALTPVTR